MCETRDLGIKSPQWHTLLVEGRVAADMRTVCPKDVKKMFLKQARTVHWKKWAATHEHEELKEGCCGWSRSKLCCEERHNEVWTDKHRNVTRKLVIDGGWVQERLYVRSVEDVTKKKGRRSCACTIARVVRRSETRSQKGW